jgi:hypothetical protein
VAVPPSWVLTGRLEDGPFDGLVVEIAAGQETVVMDDPPLFAFGGGDEVPASPYSRSCAYRFVGLEDVEDPAQTDEATQRAVFKLVGPQ